jgi:small conductance mechanosensitive channel
VTGCGDDPTRLCSLVEDLTGNPDVAAAVDVWLARPLRVVVIVVVAVVVYRLLATLVRRSVRRYEAEIHRRVERAEELGTADTGRAETRRLQRLHAISGAVRSGLGIIIGFSAFFAAVAVFVDLRPILAGAGLAGIVIGFGAQQLIADLLAGFSMLVEDQYGVGDWIDVDGRIGEVEKVGLRATSFRDLDGVVWHVPNGQVAMVGNLTQRWARATLEIPLPLDVDIAEARRIVSRVAHGLASDERWADDIIGEPEIWGVTEWSERGLRLRLVVPTRPLRNWDVNRQLRERLKIAFDRAGIRMPVPLQEVAGAPGRRAVHTAATEPDEPTVRDSPRFDPTTAERLEAETGWIERVDPDATGPAT